MKHTTRMVTVCLPASVQTIAALNRNRPVYTLRKNALECLMERIPKTEHAAK